MSELLRRFLNRRFWRRLTFASWQQKCRCQRCSLHAGRCAFPRNGERYSYGMAVLSLCTSCALNRDDLSLDRSWGKGHGAKTWRSWQEADFGKEGVFHGR